MRGRTPLHAACEAECAGDGACIAVLFASLEAQSGAERAARADALRRALAAVPSKIREDLEYNGGHPSIAHPFRLPPFAGESVSL